MMHCILMLGKMEEEQHRKKGGFFQPSLWVASVAVLEAGTCLLLVPIYCSYTHDPICYCISRVQHSLILLVHAKGWHSTNIHGSNFGNIYIIHVLLG